MTSLNVFFILTILRTVFCGNTYRITDESDFSIFEDSVNKGRDYFSTTIYLDADLSLSKYYYLSPIPIGINSTCQFRGTFDGQGHVISNFKISSSSFDYVGLFGYSEGLTVKNVVFGRTCSLERSYSSSGSGHPFIGGIIGKCESSIGNCNIENCVNMGRVTFSGSINNDLYIGGIAGYLSSSSYSYRCIVKNCANYGSILHSGLSAFWGVMGGIVGYYGSNRIQNCFNYGSVIHGGTSNYVYMGGIVGFSYSSYIENCVSAGKLSYSGSSTSYIGSVVGYVGYVSSYSITHINYCYYTNDVGVHSLYKGGSPYSTTNTTGSFYSGSVDLSLISKLNSQATSNGWNKWLLNSNNRTVSFKVNNGGFILSSQIILLPDFASGLLVFSGWYTDLYYSFPFQQSSVAESTTIYGKWNIIVTVILNENGSGNVPSSKNVTFNSTYGDLPTPSRTGYTFDGWFTETTRGDPVTNSTIVTLSYDHTLYAQWVVNKYFITIEDEDGGIIEVGLFNYGVELPFFMIYKPGYVTRYTTEEGDVLTTVPDYDATLYVKFVIITYTMTFAYENGTVIGSRAQSYGSAINFPSVEREGHTFAGWRSRENLANITSVPASNMTFYTMFSVNTYKVNIVYNMNRKIVKEYKYGEVIDLTVLEESVLNEYEIIGWYVDKECTNKIENNTITIPAHNINIYPHIVSSQVEIVLGIKGVSERDVESIIKEYTDAEFVIEVFEDYDEIKVIIKFIDAKEANKFIEAIENSPENGSIIKTVNFNFNDLGSFSSALHVLTQFLYLFL